MIKLTTITNGAWGAGMLARRSFCLSALGAITYPVSGFCQVDDTVAVRIRADDSAGASIPPIVRRNLAIRPDDSKEAQDLVRRAPPAALCLSCWLSSEP
jgi:hypothetical protein